MQPYLTLNNIYKQKAFILKLNMQVLNLKIEEFK